MIRKRITGFLGLLMAAVMAGYGCGQSSVANTSAADTAGMEKTAKVSMSFEFPREEGDVQASVISTATTHILVKVTQWAVDDLNRMRVVNTDKVLVTRSSGSTSASASLDLFPTWTRIGVSQWKGDPNDYETSERLETAITFGKLSPGTNNMLLNMLRGTWTLNTAFNGVSNVALNNPASSYNPVFDGDPSYYDSPFDLPGQCLNNWGCLYETMFKKDGAYKFLQGGAAYNNTFTGGSSTASNAPYLMIGAAEEVKGAFGNVSTVTGFGIAGIAKKADTSGVLGEDLNMINPRCEGYYNCDEPVLFSAKMETKILQYSSGAYSSTPVTGTILDKCQLTITNGNTITACGGTETSILDKVDANLDGIVDDSDANKYKILSTVTIKDASICYDNGEDADRDSSGNTICVSYDYSSQPNYGCYDSGMTFNTSSWRCEQTIASACSDLGGAYDTSTGSCTGTSYTGSSICSSQPYYSYYNSTSGICYNSYYYTSGYSYNCWDGGTFNNSTGRCEASLENTCTDFGNNTDATYSNGTCTYQDVGYAQDISFTAVSMTGVGSLPATGGVTTSKTSKPSVNWKGLLK